jgi:hypothetical protein
LCALLQDMYGSGWPHRLGLPEAPEEQEAAAENPFSAQWGYLQRLFGQAPSLRHDRARASLVGQAWWIRNELAHCRPVGFAVFDRFWEQLMATSLDS